MRGFKLVWLAIAATGLALGLAACGDDDSGGGGGGEETLDLTIGDSLPLTGDLADFGPPGEKAADIAADEINAAIEEVGADHTVEVIHEDNGGGADPQAAVSSAEKLVADGASCIAGAWASSDTIPVAESVAIPDEVLLITPASTSFEITGLEDDGLVNRTTPTDNLQGPALADLVEESLGGAEGKTVNIGARNDAYGTGFADFFQEAWESKGGTIGERVEYDPKIPSYDSEAEQIVSGSPDGIVIIDFPETYAKVGPALVRTGDFDPTKAFITDGLATTQLFEVGPEATEGLRGTAPGTPQEGASSDAFDELFTSSEPKDVERQTFDAQNFDAVVLCYLAAVAAGSTDGVDMAESLADVTGPGGDKFTWEELPAAVEALQNGDDIDYVGASGELDLDSAGDPTVGVYDTYEIVDGEIVTSKDQIPAEGAAE